MSTWLKNLFQPKVFNPKYLKSVIDGTYTYVYYQFGTEDIDPEYGLIEIQKIIFQRRSVLHSSGNVYYYLDSGDKVDAALADRVVSEATNTDIHRRALENFNKP